MKVKDLLAILRETDPEANVVLNTQPHYPLEHALSGVVVRSDYSDLDGPVAGSKPNDVLLLEGSQLRYGARMAWDRSLARR
jgi:hypothetical protein